MTSKTSPPAAKILAPGVPIRFIGCDVGKANIVVFDSQSRQTHTIANHLDPLTRFLGGLGENCLVICEATGGYEDLLLQAAILTNQAAHRADARKVKAFIRSFGILGKTDAIDAKALASYGQERYPRLARWQACDTDRDELQTLVLTRRDLVAQRVACDNRLAAPGAAPAVPFLTPLRACLDTQIRAIDTQIERVIKANETFETAVDTLRTIKGVGAKTAAALLALMPELGRLGRQQAAALAGLAPHPNQSGAKDGSRRVKGGRPEIKRLLFMPALSAAKHDQTLAPFYKKLVTNGKKKMVALTAIMRKIIVIANAKLRDALAQAEIKIIAN